MLSQHFSCVEHVLETWCSCFQIPDRCLQLVWSYVKLIGPTNSAYIAHTSWWVYAEVRQNHSWLGMGRCPGSDLNSPASATMISFCWTDCFWNFAFFFPGSVLCVIKTHFFLRVRKFFLQYAASEFPLFFDIPPYKSEYTRLVFYCYAMKITSSMNRITPGMEKICPCSMDVYGVIWKKYCVEEVCGFV